ncbi:MAG: 50S ribosomal protein L9 [Deltaproteobacteria bacterium]|nr:50S ribosomal protein L9 [Deltaproteobacteria bacterium]
MAQNVQIILARDVPNLGKLGELVAVRPGYARNFLIPNQLALPASPKRVALFTHQKQVIEHKRRLLRAESETKAKGMSGVTVSINAKVGEQNKLFGSINARDISKALAAIGHTIHHKDIKLVDLIKAVGTYTVDVRLEADVSTQIKVVIVPEIETAQTSSAMSDAEILASAPTFAVEEKKPEKAPAAAES